MGAYVLWGICIMGHGELGNLALTTNHLMGLDPGLVLVGGMPQLFYNNAILFIKNIIELEEVVI
jgi:hypothetical protein